MPQPTQGGSPGLDIEPSRSVATTRVKTEVPGQQNNKPIGQLAECSSSQVDMEQESEGGQAAATAMEALELDSKVRAEAQLGFQQMRSIEQQLRTAPQGVLGRADVSEAQALRTTVFSASVIIVGSFTKIIGLLSANSPPNPISFRNDNFSASNRIGRVESPLSTSHTCDSSPPQSPRPRHPSLVAAAANSKEPMTNPTSPVISPVTTPHSGSVMSDNSPNHVLLDSDGDTAGGAAAPAAPRRPANEVNTSADAEVVKQRTVSLKRKFMPKFTCKQRVSPTDPGNDSPPGDGHTWRKYGQKDILGSRNPRSYYRCTHKIELGCPAIKYVQRCDEESSMFNVTYRGNHSCQSIHQQHPSWPFSCSPGQILAITRAHHQLLPSDTSPVINYLPGLRGSHHDVANSSAAPQSHVMARTDDILLGGSDHFVQLGLPTGGVVSSRSGLLDIPSGPNRFGPSSSTMELGLQQRGGISLKHEDDSCNPSELPAAYDESTLARDTLFHESSLFQMLMATPMPPLGQNDIIAASTLVEDLPSPSTGEDLPSPSDPKRVKVQQHLPMEPARSSSDNSNLRPEDKYLPRWGARLDSDDHGFQLQLDGSVRLSYHSSSSIMSDSCQAREVSNNHTTSGDRLSVAVRELENSARAPVVPSLPMGGFTIDDMDYESFPINSTFPSGSTFYC